eukprot:3100649-Lingulodinium_polyedra.AAC.1
MEAEEVVSTQHLAARACEECEKHACFWLRGLVPRPWVEVHTPWQQQEVFTYVDLQGSWGACEEWQWEPGTCYTDASGGAFGSIPALRR